MKVLAMVAALLAGDCLAETPILQQSNANGPLVGRLIGYADIVGRMGACGLGGDLADLADLARMVAERENPDGGSEFADDVERRALAAAGSAILGDCQFGPALNQSYSDLAAYTRAEIMSALD